MNAPKNPPRGFPGVTSGSSEKETVAQKEFLRLAAEHRRAVERLEYLYEISRLLATFESVEETFPKILSLTAGTFPLRSAILIQKSGVTSIKILWPTSGLSDSHRKQAIDRAESYYHYLSGTLPDSKSPQGRPELEGDTNYLILPLVVIHLPVFGVIQLEGHHVLGEEDLKFANAFANLIAVALDRQHRVEKERKIQKGFLDERSAELTESQREVSSLEIERQLRERFVSSLSHDLRTPLTAARMNAELIFKQPEKADFCQTLANRILLGIDRVDQMIRDLLDANRIRAGEKIHLDVARCDLRATAVETLELLVTVYGDRFVLQSSDKEIWGLWNRDALRRVLENLLSNAVKYGYSDRPITLSLKQEEEKVVISVHNEGDAISLRDQENLFVHFRRTDTAASGKNKGWGLGLALVRGLLEAQGGRIWVESLQGRGTTFVAEIPKEHPTASNVAPTNRG